jgi:hypothetical protein
MTWSSIDASEHLNKLVEVNTGRTLSVIDAETGKAGLMNHDRIQPSRWSADSSSLLWEVDVRVISKEDEPLSLPLSLHASLESNPKALEFPLEVQLSSGMEAIVDLDGKLIVRDFRMESEHQ